MEARRKKFDCDTKLRYDFLAKQKGWAISWSVLRSIIQTTPRQVPVLEFGSGLGTSVLKKYFDIVVSVEHDARWIAEVQGVEYIHAPLEPYETSVSEDELPHQPKWYNMNILSTWLEKHPRINFGVVVIDGPPGKQRNGFATFWPHLVTHLMKKTLLVFDDTQRPFDKQLWEYMHKHENLTHLGDQWTIDQKQSSFAIKYLK